MRHSFHHLALPLVLLTTGSVAHADFEDALTPPFRGAPEAEFANWHVFTTAVGGPNLPQDPATTSLDSTLTQLVAGAVITATGNIYNPAGVSEFVVTDSVPADLQEVWLQIRHLGNPVDFTTVRLTYVDAGGATVQVAHDTRLNLHFETGPFGVTAEDLLVWNLSGIPDAISSYEILFDASGTNMSLDDLMIDTRFGDVPIGQTYCGPAFPNSSGLPAVLSAGGSQVVALADLTLTVEQLPAGEFGYFLLSEAQGVLNPPGSSGLLCLGGNIGRFNAPAQIVQGPAGSLAVDLSAVPANPPRAVQPGDTWNFQCWYRDGGTSNFSDGMSITFQ